MVHLPAKFRENTAMRFQVAVRKPNVMKYIMPIGLQDKMDGRGARQEIKMLDTLLI